MSRKGISGGQPYIKDSPNKEGSKTLYTERKM